MDWQFTLTVIAIMLALGFIAWRGRLAWRSMRGTGCSGGCGCAKTTEQTGSEGALIAPEKLTLRQR